MANILVLNGPNLNLLGGREPDQYGHRSLQEIMEELDRFAGACGHQLRHVQNNSEGALVDIWQANAHGRYMHEGDTSEAPLDPNFQYWAQMKTDAEGRYRYVTIKPAAYTAMGEWVRPPHIHYKVSRRGYRELTTQMYFAGEALNEKDLLLQEVPEELRSRLIVAFENKGDMPEGVFDVVLGAVKPT